MFGLTRPNRSHSSNSFDSSTSGNYIRPAEVPEARTSIDSELGYDDMSTPPPSYDDVVSDNHFTPSVLTPVFHHEAYRNKLTRKYKSENSARFHEYGLQNSKIYVKD